MLSVSEKGRRSWRLTPCVEFGFSKEPSGSRAEVFWGFSALQQSLGESIEVCPAATACKSLRVRMPLPPKVFYIDVHELIPHMRENWPARL